MSSAEGENTVAAARKNLAGVRVLVVEDAWHVAKALKSTLEDMGMCVAGPVARIADAKHLLDKEVPDLAVVDVNLKGEMAYGLIGELHDRGVRVIVVSGYAVLPSSLDKAAAILQKPFSGSALLTTLQQVMKDKPPQVVN
jgi:DNA-binding NtrC family response regulator